MFDQFEDDGDDNNVSLFFWGNVVPTVERLLSSNDDSCKLYDYSYENVTEIIWSCYDADKGEYYRKKLDSAKWIN